MTGLEGFLFSFFNLRVMATYWPRVLEGLGLTVLLALLVLVAGLGLGLVLAVIRAFGIRPLNWLIIFVVDLFRALPPLVIIMLLFFGLPSVGLSMSGFAATWLSLTLVLMAFSEEVYWAGITAIPKGQWEAARSTGLGFLQTLRFVVLPQAIRMTIPPLTNRAISITKGTALGSVVGVSEILGASQSAMSFSSNPSPLTLGAIAYVILFLPLVGLARWVETRFAWKR
jgi:polar amino acid transport system permease protein